MRDDAAAVSSASSGAAVVRRPALAAGDLVLGTPRVLELEPGQPVALALDVRVPGPVRVAVEGQGTLVLDGAPVGRGLVLPLAAGRHDVEVHGGGPVVVTTEPGPGARASPEPAGLGGIEGHLAPGGGHWIALQVPDGGPWTFDASASSTRVGLSVLRGRQHLGWAGPPDAPRLTLDLEPGEVLVHVSDLAGQGGSFRVRAERVPGSTPKAPARAERADDALAQEWVTRLEVTRTRWLRLRVERAGPHRVEVEADDGRVAVELAREGVVLAAAEGQRATRLVGWLAAGAHVVRVSGRPDATVHVRLVPDEHADPARLLAHLRLVPVPAARATVGRSRVGPGGVVQDDPLADARHEPPRTVTLASGLLVSAHEVTQRAFVAVMGRDPSSRRGDDLPTHEVSFDDAAAFCRSLTHLVRDDPVWGRYVFRLPTEDEWEACCRAGAAAPIAVSTGPTNRRPFAARLEEVAWFQSHRPGRAARGPFPVGMRAPNAWGLFDVHGNVAEWCLPSPTLPPPPDGLAPLRGGSWTTDYRGCRASNRDLVPARFASASTGFRVVAVPR